MWGLINQDHKSYLTQPVETTTLSNSPLTGILTGITQERINEMRAAPEQVMICDIHDILATGQDLNRTDAQGATLVSETAAASVLLSFSPQVMKPPGAGVTQSQHVQVPERRHPTEQNTSADLQGTGPGRPPSNLLLLT